MSIRQSLLLSAAGGLAFTLFLAPQAQAIADVRIDAIPPMPLGAALDAFAQRSGLQIVYVSNITEGKRTKGAPAGLSPEETLKSLLYGTGLHYRFIGARTVTISENVDRRPSPAPNLRAVAPAPAAVETVVVTAQKKTENIQNVPIAVTALSQAQLTERQIAGGPDLVKEVPNLTFSKTNFTGYNIQIRGIGTQAISVTTDPAVAVAFNGTPFIRNHFFEQEFYDLQDVEVLRGPQGTLYGRNATAGVVNVKSALPTDQYEAMLSADIGNFSNRRLEAMLNLPIVGDKLDIRFAGEWTKRDGYSFNELTNAPIDGRDLWSGRAELRWRPSSDLDVNLIWERFQENDDRMRTAKQLCKTALPPASIGGVPVGAPGFDLTAVFHLDSDYLSQGCLPTSLYSPDAFQVPYGYSLPYAVGAGVASLVSGARDPYASTTQSTNLRIIESTLNPRYIAKNDTLELNADYRITPVLTLTSQTGFNQDFLWSTEDYNRFNTAPGFFQNGNFCDPQLGCSDRLVAQDLSDEHAWQLSQEFRLSSNFGGPLNFSIGGNYLHYETEENYYVFINSLTALAFASTTNGYGGPPDNSGCLPRMTNNAPGAWGYQNNNPATGGGTPTRNCPYVDPNPIGSLNNEGHNYFLSKNPYELNSYAGFGEVYYGITDALKLTGGLRWTEDRKRFFDIPSEVDTGGFGYFVTQIVDQQWDKFTGRAAVDWTPKLEFTDQTLVYSSFARGYKAGGANPPGAVFPTPPVDGQPRDVEPIHPLTFKPEFIDAYEIGSKNTLLDGALTLNGDAFYYNYKDYQISEIVDRTSINLNFNATVKGAELETSWEPEPGLKFSFAGGYEDTRIDSGQSAIDLMDRTDSANHPGWMVIKPFPTEASNCILPDYVVATLLEETASRGEESNAAATAFACDEAYLQHLDPATLYPYAPNPSGMGGINYVPNSGNAYAFPIPGGYPGFDPTQPAINNGEGFAKPLGGHQLPNAPHFTTSFSAEYSIPVSDDWAATLHGDFYWQSQSFARVFNDVPYDRIHGYSNVNLALILTSANGWQVMGYVKNLFDTTAITGDFLNSDDSGLTTNIFLTDPRLYGVRVTKQLDEGDGFWGSEYSGADFFTGLLGDKDNGKPVLWIEIGGGAEEIFGQGDVFAPAFLAKNSTSPVFWKGTSPLKAQKLPLFSFDEEAKVSFEPAGSDLVFSAAAKIGRSGNTRNIDHQTGRIFTKYSGYVTDLENFANTKTEHSESHAILDFGAGKDVGLGIFGSSASSTVNLGVRFAQFASNAAFDIRARPDLRLHYKYMSYDGVNFLPNHYFHTYHATGRASRNFRGVGPSISWNGSMPFIGNLNDGEVAFDWGANAALLFGKQRTRVQHQESGHYNNNGGLAHAQYTTVYVNPVAARAGDRSITIPNLGGSIGLSYRYNNAKISFGYRADEFFGAMDGGIDTRKSENVGFFGPYANISIGLGG